MSSKTSWIAKSFDFAFKYRWLLFLILLIAISFMGYGMRNLSVSNDYRNFFDSDNAELTQYEGLQQKFGKSDNVLIVVTAKDGSVITNDNLQTLRWATAEAWKIPFSTRVESIINFQAISSAEDDIVVSDLVDKDHYDEQRLNRLRTSILHEPLLMGRLINEGMNVTAINVTITLPGLSLDEAPSVAKFARDLASSLEAKNSNLQVGLTGVVMMDNAFGEATAEDAARLIPLMFLIAFLMLWLLIRSISLASGALLMFLLTVIATLGLAGWSRMILDPVTMSAPIIILTIVIADSVHLLSGYKSSLIGGADRLSSMKASLKENILPVFLTSITTALGFVSMNLSDAPPIRNLGNIVAAGVVIAFALSVTFLPIFAVMVPTGKYSRTKPGVKIINRLADLCVSSRVTTLLLLLVGSFGFALLSLNNTFNDNLVEYFEPGVEFREDTDYASNILTGPYFIEFSVSVDGEGNIFDPEYLVNLEKFVRHLESYEETRHVFSLSDTMKRLNRSMHGGDPAWFVMPDNRELAAQYFLLYEMSLPYGLSVNDQVNADKTSSRVVMATKNLDAESMLRIEDLVEKWAAVNMPGTTVTSSSPSLMVSHLSSQNSKSLVQSAVTALAFISIFFVVAFRSLKIALISLIPNILPAGVAFGIWAIIDGEVGMSVSIIVGMTLGIVVDDSIHLVSRYMRARREHGMNPREAAHYSIVNVGVALITTSTVLVAGFLVLMLSQFKINFDMGLMASITIAAALILDLFLLPPLLILFDSKRNIPEVSPFSPQCKMEKP